MEDKSREYSSGYQSIPERENYLLAHYAIRSEDTTGRKYAEPIKFTGGLFSEIVTELSIRRRIDD